MQVSATSMTGGKKRKKAPILSSQTLESHSTSLFELLSGPFTSSWGVFKDSLQKVALILNEYATFLKKSNENQQNRQSVMHPITEACKNAHMNNIEPAENVSSKYAILDLALSKLQNYEYLFFMRKFMSRIVSKPTLKGMTLSKTFNCHSH